MSNRFRRVWILLLGNDFVRVFGDKGALEDYLTENDIDPYGPDVEFICRQVHRRKRTEQPAR